MMTDPYEVLGVRRDADDAIIEAAYRARRKEAHPDNGGSQEEFQEVEQAYESIQAGEDSKSDPGNGDIGDLFSQFLNVEPSETYTKSGNARIGEEITIEGEFVDLTLLNIIYDMDFTPLAISTKGLEEIPLRTVVMFELHNKSNRLARWRGSDLKFIDKEGYTYGTGEPIDDRKLAPRWITHKTDLEPGGRTKSVLAVERLPDDAKIEKVIYTQRMFSEGNTSGVVRDKERFEFLIGDEEGKLESLPE